MRFGRRVCKISHGCIFAVKENWSVRTLDRKTKYLIYLPTKEQLRREIEWQKEIFYMQHPALLEEDEEKDEQVE